MIKGYSLLTVDGLTKRHFVSIENMRKYMRLNDIAFGVAYLGNKPVSKIYFDGADLMPKIVLNKRYVRISEELRYNLHDEEYYFSHYFNLFEDESLCDSVSECLRCNNYVVEDAPLDRIRFTQDSVWANMVHKYCQKGFDDLPYLVLRKNIYYIWNGHHRCVSRILLDCKTVRARVVKI